MSSSSERRVSAITKRPSMANSRASIFEEAPSYHEGYLQKKTTGSGLTGFQKKYFTCSGHYLRYYATKAAADSAQDPLAAIDINQIIPTLQEGGVFELMFVPNNDNKSMILKASSPAEAKEWVNALTTLKNDPTAVLPASLPTTSEPEAGQGVKEPLKIIIAGAPASGKGTQCEEIKATFGVVHLSTGDMLRAAVKEGTELGLKAKGLMDAGSLVSDDLVIGIVSERLQQEDCVTQGWLLDGFPRTKAQADALAESGYTPNCFIFLDVPDSILVERVCGRMTDPETGKGYHATFDPPPTEEIKARCTRRDDDTEEKVGERLKAFHSQTMAILPSYSEVMNKINGDRPKADIAADILSTLELVMDELPFKSASEGSAAEQAEGKSEEKTPESQNLTFEFSEKKLGIDIGGRDGEFFIVQVTEGSAAHARGVAAKDLIMSINDTIVAGSAGKGMTHKHIGNKLRNAKRPLKLHVQRFKVQEASEAGWRMVKGALQMDAPNVRATIIQRGVKRWLDTCHKDSQYMIETLFEDSLQLLDTAQANGFCRSGSRFIHVRFGEGRLGLAVQGDAGDPTLVSAIEPGSLAESKGLRQGDRFIVINRMVVDDNTTVEDIQQVFLKSPRPISALLDRPPPGEDYIAIREPQSNPLAKMRTKDLADLPETVEVPDPPARGAAATSTATTPAASAAAAPAPPVALDPFVDAQAKAAGAKSWDDVYSGYTGGDGAAPKANGNGTEGTGAGPAASAEAAVTSADTAAAFNRASDEKPEPPTTDATDKPKVILQGWLEKRSDWIQSWNRRFLVLLHYSEKNSYDLIYFTREPQIDSDGYIDEVNGPRRRGQLSLAGAKVAMDNVGSTYTPPRYSFTLTNPTFSNYNKSHVLRTFATDDRGQWVEHLETAIEASSTVA